MSTYEGLRRQIRRVETDLQSRLTEYSQIGSDLARADTTSGSTGRRDAQQQQGQGNAKGKANATTAGLEDGLARDSMPKDEQLEVEIGQGLKRLEQLTLEMEHCLGNQSGVAMQMQLQRIQTILLDYTRDFRRVQENIHSIKRRQDLLTGNGPASARSEKTMGRHASTEADQYLGERNRIDQSHSVTDELLAQAYATRDEFAQQRKNLTGIGSRMTGALNQIPGINTVIHKINTRRRRDQFILAGVIAACVIILLLYTFR